MKVNVFTPTSQKSYIDSKVEKILGNNNALNGRVSISLWIKVFSFWIIESWFMRRQVFFVSLLAHWIWYYLQPTLAKTAIKPSLSLIHRLKHISSFAGSYIYIEASKKNPGDGARFLSDEIEPNENVCVQFWYHMHGSDTGNLSIYVKTNQSETLVWRLSGDQGNRWRFGQTTLNSPSLYKVSSHDYLLVLNVMLTLKLKLMWHFFRKAQCSPIY